MVNFKALFYFDTIQYVTVHNAKLGGLHRTLQLGVVLYIILFSIWYREGYLERSPIKGILYSKAKGLAYANVSGQFSYLDNGNNGRLVFDSNDLIVPPMEADAMYLVTAAVFTSQSRGVCSSSVKCSSDSDCNNPSAETDGQLLPTCNTTDGRCLMKAWCPLEDDSVNATLYLSGWDAITIFARTAVTYERFNISTQDSSIPVPGTNLFSVSQMINGAGPSCATKGCIVNVNIDWSCNLDNGPLSCKPKFEFTNIPGTFNIREKIVTIDSPDSRNLRKYYGIRFLFTIGGTGSRFSFFQLILVIGSGVSFLAIATLIVDMLLLTVLDKKFFAVKFLHYHRE